MLVFLVFCHNNYPHMHRHFKNKLGHLGTSWHEMRAKPRVDGVFVFPKVTLFRLVYK